MKKLLTILFLSLTTTLAVAQPATTQTATDSINKPKFVEITIPDKRVINIKGQVDGGILSQANTLVSLANTSKDPVHLVINSPGGSVLAGLQFLNAMNIAKAKGVKLVCTVGSLAASMAFHIFVACDERYAMAYSLILWHPATVGARGRYNKERLGNVRDQLALFEDRLDKVALKELNISSELYEKHRKAETLHLGVSLNALAPSFMKVVDIVNTNNNLFKVN